MTTEALQNKKVQHLTQALALIEQAQKEIRLALGDTDVGDEYLEELDIMLDNLHGDIADLQ